MRVLVFALVLACHAPRAGAPCEVVADRFFVRGVAELENASLDDALRRAAAARLPALRDALAAACRDGDWPAAVRDCLAAAGDRAAFQTCAGQLTDDQRAALDRRQSW